MRTPGHIVRITGFSEKFQSCFIVLFKDRYLSPIAKHAAELPSSQAALFFAVVSSSPAHAKGVKTMQILSIKIVFKIFLLTAEFLI